MGARGFERDDVPFVGRCNSALFVIGLLTAYAIFSRTETWLSVRSSRSMRRERYSCTPEAEVICGQDLYLVHCESLPLG
jgi:hypothetical protein